MGTTAFYPIESPGGKSTHYGNVLGEEHDSKRQHPESQEWQDAEYAAPDQQEPSRNANPSHGRLSQPAYGNFQAQRQTPDQQCHSPLMLVAGMVGLGNV
jgi:hypothetical protein